MAQPDFAEVEFPPIASEPLDCTASLGVSAQCIVLRHFREMLEQREHAWHAEDVEAVHKLRVGARRTRTALQTFSVLWPGSNEAQRHLKSLSDFADAFNAARDLDVMIIYLEEQLKKADEHRRPAITWLLERNTKLREEQRPQLHKALRKLEKDRVPEKFVAFFSKKPFSLWPEPAGEPFAAPVDEGSSSPAAAQPGGVNASPTEDPHGSQ